MGNRLPVKCLRKRADKVKIRAIVFDFDGLIIDTETPWYQAYKEVFATYDVDLPLEVWGKVIGTTFDVFDPIEYLQKQAGQNVDRKEIVAATRIIFDEIMSTQQLRLGVLRYLQTAQKLGLKIGLATSSNRRWIDTYFERYDLGHYFETIMTADDVDEVKPNPALYLQAMDALGVQGHETIVFEDSLNGLRAAKAAGAYCVVVPNRVTSFMTFEKHDLRISSMGDVTLENILTRIETRNISE